MNFYEITFITKADTKDDVVKVEIEKSGGKIKSSQNLGEKQFSYKIAKETSGVYTTIVFEIEPEKVMDLNRKLSLKEEILRYLLITTKAAKTVVKAKKLEKVIEAAPVTEPAVETSIMEQPEVALEVEPKETEIVEIKEVKKAPAKAKAKPEIAPKVEKPAPKEKVKEEAAEELSEDERLEALNKKLDELLKD